MTRIVKIALVDDHQMFLDGLGEVIRVLDPSYTCTPFSRPGDALAAIDNGNRFDLFIIDLVMAEMNGIALVMALKARCPTTPALVVSGIDTTPPIDKILAAKASGFVPKSASSRILKGAIETALGGDVFVPDHIWQVTANRSGSEGTTEADKSFDPIETLGPRQVEVVTLMAEGCSNKEIAQVLAISENTVKSHISATFKALGVTRRTACISKARALGLID